VRGTLWRGTFWTRRGAARASPGVLARADSLPSAVNPVRYYVRVADCYRWWTNSGSLKVMLARFMRKVQGFEFRGITESYPPGRPPNKGTCGDVGCVRAITPGPR
jgi:hypothetical protein